MSKRVSWLVVVSVCVFGCGSSVPRDASDSAAGDGVDAPEEASGDAGGLDAAAGDAGDVASDAAPLTACPTSGLGAFVSTTATCFQLTPIEAGAASTGENASEPSYAVRATTAPGDVLVLFFSGSRGHPAGAVKSDPMSNLYAAAVAAGRSALGISYTNATSLGILCKHDDACFFPTRESIIRGGSRPGSVIDVPLDASIVDRTARALRLLAMRDPSGGWSRFLLTLDPTANGESAIAWSKIIVVGHSQGGGHAAAIGKLFPVARVVQLSATCDSTASMTAASWTDGTNGTWASDPTLFYGLGATGDTTCPTHTLSWASFGMLPSHQDDDAATCGATGDTHDASLRCKDNYEKWVKLLQ